MRSGTDMGSLVSEMILITEVVLELARADELELDNEEVAGLSRAVGRGAAASANAYTIVRDQEIARQAQQHFSFVAHELRTPLQTAQLAVQVLDQMLDGRHARYVRSLDRALCQVLELVDNSLVEVRLSGTPDVDVRQVNAQAVVRTVCEQLRDHVEDKSIQLFTDADDFQLNADEKLLVSALTNLVRNGVKFTPSGGRLRVRARKQADQAVFEVEDECGGMSDDVPPRLFQPFVQANSDKTGHGLGLVIVKQAAEAHGGSVHVNNRPPQGCVFVLKLPLGQAGPPDAGERGIDGSSRS